MTPAPAYPICARSEFLICTFPRSSRRERAARTATTSLIPRTSAQRSAGTKARLTGAVGGIPVGDAWGDTRVDAGAAAGEGRGWSCAIHGVNIDVETRGGLSVSELFRVVPVAVMSR